MSWHALKAADASVFLEAPLVYRFPVRLAVHPDRVWESLASERSMWDWDLGVRRLTWTSPRPFGVGTTREVVLPFGAMTVRERFFRWDEGKGYSFYVAETDRPVVDLFAEDYAIEPDGEGSVFTWTIALEPKRALLPLMRVTGPLNKMALGQVPRAAKRYFARR